MGKNASQSSSDVPDGLIEHSAVFVFGTIADTTWRLFVPTVGLTLLGAWADGVYGAKPWLMIAGIILGTLVAVGLVRRQITTINAADRRRA